jgi:hypothetical protein
MVNRKERYGEGEQAVGDTISSSTASSSFFCMAPLLSLAEKIVEGV